MGHRAALWLSLLALMLALTGNSAAQQGPNRAGLVVRFPDGSVWQGCIQFSEPTITGEELLRRSGLDIIADYSSGMGGAVCSIAGAGCAFPREDCFCRCQGVQCEYWAYYHWVGGAWQYSQVGASSYQVSNGALEGWSWGPGNFSAGTEPPQVSFADVCPAPTATPTATPTPSPAATAIPLPPGPPTIFFEASAYAVAPGSCAVLKWVTWDADQVTLNGANVLAQDRQEVCPATTQRYVLQAANARGQTVREVVINVIAPTAAPTPTAGLPSPVPSSNAAWQEVPASPTSTPTVAWQIVPLTPEASPTPASAEGISLLPVAQAQEPGSTQPRATPEPTRTIAPAAGWPRALPTAVPTPASGRQSPLSLAVNTLGSAGRPSPTPLLVASLAPTAQPARPMAGQAQIATLDRHFDTALLPGYAFYLLSAGALSGAGLVVVRRRAGVSRSQ